MKQSHLFILILALAIYTLCYIVVTQFLKPDLLWASPLGLCIGIATVKIWYRWIE